MSARSQERALPRGPHGLSRDEVSRSQRARLLAGMTSAVAEKGYANTVVADVVAQSGVSRATFYQLFRDKEDCFLAAFEAAAAMVAQVLDAGLHNIRRDPGRTPIERLDHVLGLYLTVLERAPDMARVFLVEVYAAGPPAIRRRRDSLDQFVDIVAATHEGEPGVLGTRPEQRFAAELIVGAVSSMVTNLVGVGEITHLPDLQTPLMTLAREVLGASQL